MAIADVDSVPGDNEMRVNNEPEMVFVACCMCAAPIKQNPTNMCVQCIRTQVDITEGIPTSLTIYRCRGCMRWLKPGWVDCELESRELMAICLRKINGLKKVKLVDASWVWTEAHSQRLKCKLTVQKEVQNGAILQQAFLVEFVIRNQQCVDCEASYTNNTWKAVIQVRQRVDHKRSFFYLEQLILKHNAHTNALSVQTHKDGMDFFYGERNQGQRMLGFLESVIPVRLKQSKKLISADNHSNTYNFHYTTMVTIVPVCKDDLVLIPPRLSETLGQLARLCLVQRVNSSIMLVDPLTALTGEVNVEHYGKHEFPALQSSTQLVPFVVLGIEPLPPANNPTMRSGRKMRRARLAEAVVARESDLGSNDTQFTVITHLGHLLRAGDTVLGYDVSSANLPEDALHSMKNALPDVVLVRKLYGSAGAEGGAQKKRAWQLAQLEKDAEAELTKREAATQEEDYERFMQQLEGDKEMRRGINLYKTSNTAGATSTSNAAPGSGENNTTQNEDNDVDEEEIRLEELLDDLRLDDSERVQEAQIFESRDVPEAQFAELELGDDEDDDL